MLLRIIVEIVSRKCACVNYKFTVNERAYKKQDFVKGRSKEMGNLVVGILTVILAACAGVKVL